ncbi:MAG: (E)-4-hydroxy-3-methylbut-2-enyl-diphosphate synthase [Marinilabiliaceae bacterium]|nr:(E)-4-hydroxy-3-methylbut-2-enyl-diphosphate synthase [Marinilabiliaceae bacterium]
MIISEIEATDAIQPVFYCDSLFKYSRFKTSEVSVGNVLLGGNNPIAIQSMTTTDTMDAAATADQSINVFNSGGEIVRITAQGQREATNLEAIRKIISEKGYTFPLVADIHFNPSAAMIAATIVEKVRINPGNFADGVKKFKQIDYSNNSYLFEIENIKSKFIPFIKTCKKHNCAIRIGVNHGSLSDRIMSRYGDTPHGMVESCMEYLRICVAENFGQVILSIKSSNTRVMVHTVRLLSATMKKENMNFPLHLGVTEAGSGEDGRIKSAVGIGALLADGLGDTIRFSLTEQPENEILPAKILLDHFQNIQNHKPVAPANFSTFNPYEYSKRKSHQVLSFGGKNIPLVVADLRDRKTDINILNFPDAIIVDNQLNINDLDKKTIQIIPYKYCKENSDSRTILLYEKSDINNITTDHPIVIQLNYNDLDSATISYLKKRDDIIILLTSSNINTIAEQRAFFLKMNENQLTHPVIIHRRYNTDSKETFQIKSSADMGIFFLDGFGDGLSLSAPKIEINCLIETHYAILQASRVRFSKTEFISCPGCGRTLFDIQKTEAQIKEKSSHLKGLKIAIMGCIVNGLGEMADADWGYVGAAKGKISLFKNKELIEKNIPEEKAVNKLIEEINKEVTIERYPNSTD